MAIIYYPLLPSGGSSSSAFGDITSGTNMIAAMVVGSGASLTFGGAGTINASSLLGSTWASPAVIGSIAPAAATFTALTVTTSATISGTLVDGTASVGTNGQVLSSTVTGVKWVTPTSASAFSALTSGTNTTAAMVVGTGASLGVSGSGTINATTLLSNTWAIPAAIGSTTPAAGTFTTLTANTSLVVNGGTALTTSNQTGTGSLVLATSPTISAPTISGHPTVEGVTSTGATGSGNFVFSVSPTITGTLTCATLAATTINGAALSGTFTGNPTFSGNVTLSAELIDGSSSAGTSGYVLSSTGSNVAWVNPATIPSGSVAFSGITTGANTAAAMTVGAGASLNFASSGVINASTLLGATWAAPAAIGSGTPAAGTFTALTATTSATISGTLIDGTASAGTSGQVLSSTVTGVAWVTPPSATAFSALTSGTNTTAAMVVGTGASLNFSGSGTINASTLLGSTWAVPAAIGGTTPAAGTFTALAANTSLAVKGTLSDGASSVGSSQQVLSSTGTGVAWVASSTLPSQPDEVLVNGSVVTTCNLSVLVNGVAPVGVLQVNGNVVKQGVQSMTEVYGQAGIPGSTAASTPIGRVLNTVYYNATGFPILVMAAAQPSSGNSDNFTGQVGSTPTLGTTVFYESCSSNSGGNPVTITFFVAAGQYYKVASSGGSVLFTWREFMLTNGTFTDSGNISGSRALSTIYQNNSTNTLFVLASISVAANTVVQSISDAFALPTNIIDDAVYGAATPQTATTFLVVPPGYYYKIVASGGSITAWHEYTWTIGCQRSIQLSALRNYGTASVTSAGLAITTGTYTYFNPGPKIRWVHILTSSTNSACLSQLNAWDDYPSNVLLNYQGQASAGKNRRLYGPIMPGYFYTMYEGQSGTLTVNAWYEYIFN